MEALVGLSTNGYCKASPAPRRQSRRVWLREGEITFKTHWLTSQKSGGDALDPPRLRHHTALCFGPQVHGKNLIQVCCGSKDRLASDAGRDPAGQGIGAPKMAAEDGNGILPCFVHHHHRRVGGFAFDIGRNGPDGDPRRANEYQGISLRERLFGPGGQRAVRPASGGFAVQVLCQGAGQGFAPVGKGQQSDGHGVPSR